MKPPLPFFLVKNLSVMNSYKVFVRRDLCVCFLLATEPESFINDGRN